VIKKLYKRLALVEVTEDEYGTTVNLKLEPHPALDWENIFKKDSGMEERLYAALVELRTRENFAEYHSFCEHLIQEFVELWDNPQ